MPTITTIPVGKETNMNIEATIKRGIKLPKIEYHKCICGQKIEIVHDMYGTHILGHFKPVTFKNRVPRYRTCPMSGEKPPEKGKKGDKHVAQLPSVQQDTRPGSPEPSGDGAG